jgi:hypothetical protein
MHAYIGAKNAWKARKLCLILWQNQRIIHQKPRDVQANRIIDL